MYIYSDINTAGNVDQGVVGVVDLVVADVGGVTGVAVDVEGIVGTVDVEGVGVVGVDDVAVVVAGVAGVGVDVGVVAGKEGQQQQEEEEEQEKGGHHPGRDQIPSPSRTKSRPEDCALDWPVVEAAVALQVSRSHPPDSGRRDRSNLAVHPLGRKRRIPFRYKFLHYQTLNTHHL